MTQRAERSPRSPAATLREVFLNAVVPGLIGEPAPARTGPESAARCANLAASLMEAGQDAMPNWLATLQEDGSPVTELADTLFEPAARHLGDLWADESCSEVDVTFALCRLQNLARLLAPARPILLRTAPSILIAPEPGELHRLGAALDSIVMEAAGWAPVCANPENEDALRGLVADTWFDVLDLSLSAAFRREQDLPRVAETIADARRASRNPGLKIIVGGRVFAEENWAGRQVGADAVHHSARLATRAVARLMGQREGYFFF